MCLIEGVGGGGVGVALFVQVVGLSLTHLGGEWTSSYGITNCYTSMDQWALIVA